MAIVFLNESHSFPALGNATSDGLLAVGGDLSPERLLKAYANAIFPWYSDDLPIMWWSPDPRMVLFPEKFKISKSLKHLIRKDTFTVKFDTCFEDVIQLCQKVTRKGQNGTWITSELMEAFTILHKMGYAHSVETFLSEKLVGGLYGLSHGGIFFGESMFQKESNASKVALYYLTVFLKKHNFDLIDVQQETKHLKSLGAELMPRNMFKKTVDESLNKPTLVGKWDKNFDNEEK